MGPGGGFGVRVLRFVAFFGRSFWRLALHSAHKPCPTLKPFIDFRALKPTQYWVFNRRLPLPIPPTIAVC